MFFVRPMPGVPRVLIAGQLEYLAKGGSGNLLATTFNTQQNNNQHSSIFCWLPYALYPIPYTLYPYLPIPSLPQLIFHKEIIHKETDR